MMARLSDGTEDTSMGGRNHHRLVILVLGALAAIGPFSTDMYLPGFPAMARDLGTDVARVGFTLTSYFIGICLGQLLGGPMLDRYGRRKPMLLGLLLYSATSLGCVFAPSIDYLIGLRFFAALGGCVGMVGSRAIVRDLFSGREIARAMSMLMMVFGVAPIIAPTIGGIVVASLGWRFIFGVLAGIGLVVFVAVWRTLRETKHADLSVSLHPRRVLREYLAVLKQPAFLIYTGAAAAGSGGLFSYITGSPFVFIDLFGFTVTQFGWIYGLNACSLIAANQLNRMLLRKYTSRDVLLAFTIIQFVTGLLLVSGGMVGFLPQAAALGLIFCFLFCFGLILANATALALEPFSRNAGTASALIGACQMVVGALASASVSALHTGTIVPVALMMCTSAAVALTLLIAAVLFLKNTDGATS